MKSWFRSEERLFRLEDEGLDQTADSRRRSRPLRRRDRAARLRETAGRHLRRARRRRGIDRSVTARPRPCEAWLRHDGRDWHTLLEFCGLVGTLIADEDGIYDPRHINDRLLLGMKGTIEARWSCRCCASARSRR